MARQPMHAGSLVRHPYTKEVMSLQQVVAGGHAALSRVENFSASGRGKPRPAHFVDFHVPEEERVMNSFAGKQTGQPTVQVPAKVWKELHQHLPAEPEESGPEYASQADLDHLFNDRRS